MYISEWLLYWEPRIFCYRQPTSSLLLFVAARLLVAWTKSICDKVWGIWSATIPGSPKYQILNIPSIIPDTKIYHPKYQILNYWAVPSSLACFFSCPSIFVHPTPARTNLKKTWWFFSSKIIILINGNGDECYTCIQLNHLYTSLYLTFLLYSPAVFRCCVK